MERPEILLTSILPQKGMTMLQEHCAITYPERIPHFSRDEILDRLPGKTGLVSLLSDRIDRTMLDAGDRLKVIANYAVGYNNIDCAEASKRRIVVTNTPDVLTETTADLTFSLILAIARRIVEADRFMRSGAFTGWLPNLLLGTDVHGKTLGIVGFGRIGQAVAKRAHGFGMHVLYSDVEPRSHAVERTYEAIYCDLTTLLGEANFVSLHVPLTEHTRHLLSEQELSCMKPGAFLINVARGPVVDETALIKALRNKTIAGCALDVYENEPEVASELLALDNTILVPHIGSATEETRANMAVMVAESILSVVIRGDCPCYIVNPEIYSM
ncbi:D-glycerate dehydrogenase [candidate division WOR-3 bacterium]|nr:D-glycerate dehydrogenase [candidate division WOR-3 bacterium]